MRRNRSGSAGASLVEVIVVVGVVALMAIAGFRVFGGSVKTAIDHEGQKVAALEQSQSGAGAPSADNGSPACTGGTCQGGSSCFAAGTLVATPGGLVPIERIRAGDEVVSFDVEARQVRTSRVTATFVTLDRDVVDVHLAGDIEPLRVTPGHLFYRRDGAWVGAEALGNGDPLLDTSGSEVDVAYVDTHPPSEAVYNFEVEGTHTYFVGGARVLVHNPVATIPAGNGNSVHSFIPPNPNAPIAIVKLTDQDPTVNLAVQALQNQYPNAKIVPYSSFDPSSPTHDPHALTGVGDLIVVGHGAENPNVGPGHVVIGDPGVQSHGVIQGEHVGIGLENIGYQPGKVPGVQNPEVFVVSCNSAVGCASTPSVAQGIADEVGQTTHGFTEPIKVIDIPGTGTTAVLVGNNGTVQTFQPAPPQKTCVIQ
jgi:hypothetical protein